MRGSGIAWWSRCSPLPLWTKVKRMCLAVRRGSTGCSPTASEAVEVHETKRHANLIVGIHQACNVALPCE